MNSLMNQYDEKIVLFNESKKYGKKQQDIFQSEFLEFLKLKFQDVSDKQQYYVEGIDFKSTYGPVDVKTQSYYKGIIIEEWSDYPNLDGWYYKTKAKLIVYVRPKTRSMIILPFTEAFKELYEEIKDNYEIIPNDKSVKDKSEWRSAYRVVPFNDITGFYAIYHKPYTDPATGKKVANAIF